jgi:hypothetical protein
MTPNADRDNPASIPINQATFLMSNMVAQAPDNNQGAWADLEGYLRTLIPDNELYIVAGPAGLGGKGDNGFTTTVAGGAVAVPAWTWKAALVIPAASGDDVARVTCTTRTIAVIMPNDNIVKNHDWTEYLTTVDAVEALTGYDLFSNVPEPYQRCIEAGVNGVNPKLASFSNLDAPQIEAGTAATAISGSITAGATIPTGSVAVSVGGATALAAIGADGRFTALVPTASLAVAGSPYAVSFSYAGNADFTWATAASTLAVVDTTAPVIGAITATPNLVTVPNHKMFGVFVDYAVTDVSGAVCSLSVGSNEAVNGSDDGNTAVDWLTTADPHDLQLRAERAGNGSGRVYTITATCTDASGNSASKPVTVSVPK